MDMIYSLMTTLLPFDWLSSNFMKNAFLAVLLVTPLFGLISTMVVSNRMAFFSDSLGHGAFTGIAIGVLLGSVSPLLSLLVAENHQETVLVATENGFGKRTVLADFRHSGRGNQGVIAIAASERNGKVVAARLVKDEDEIMLITTGGVLIRTRVAEIRELGRATQGVTLIALDEGEKLAGLEKVVETEDEAENGADGDAATEQASE